MRKMHICYHNQSVDCFGEPHCYNCGWNPKIAEARAAEIRKTLKGGDPSVLESALEVNVCRYVQLCGGKAYKFVSPGRPGVPDRICVFPNGRIIFVELKRPGRDNGLSAQQEKTINVLKDLGCCVWVINDLNDFKHRLHDLELYP